VNATTADAGTETRARERDFLDRALAVLPIVGLGLLVLSFYFVEAWTRKTPWLFTDELEWSQLSRSIASTGHAARRGDPIFFKSIYSYLIAPFWWIHSTHTAYSGIKYLNAFMMSLAAVPTYFLARMLVSRRAALVTAVLAVAIPGMSYVTTIIPESLAYTWFALCSWLIVRALATRRLRHVVLAVAVSIGAVLVKSELELALGAFVIAAGGLWLTGPRGRAWRVNWTRGDTIGAIVLLLGANFLFNRVVLSHIHTWQISSQYWKGRMVDYGLTAGAALAIGLGLVPVIAGFVALRLPERRGQPVYRAFAAYLAASMLFFSLYTAGKAAFLSTDFATFTEERNLIYLSPLLLVATAMVFESRRIDWRIVALAAVFVLYIVLTKPLQLGYPYFEAPGLSVLALLNRNPLDWGVGTLHWLLFVVGVIGLILLATRHRRGVTVAATTLLLAWMLAGEIGATAGDDDLANRFNSNLPNPPNKIDLLTHGQHVTLLGQFLQNDPNGIWLAEFWNRSIAHVGAIDGSAPGPGPGIAPDLVSVDGALSRYTGDHYILAGSGVTLQGTPIGDWNGLILYRIRGPWKLLDAWQQHYSDGWCPAWCAYTYFANHGPGTLVVEVARTAYRGPLANPGHVTITVGTVKLDHHGAPGIGRTIETRHVRIFNGGDVKVPIRLQRTPVRVRVDIDPVIPGPTASDTRRLGAQVSFLFEPAR
jgi:hypothetical protein